MDMIDVMNFAVTRGASDIHIAVGEPPLARINGKIQALKFDDGKPMAALNGETAKSLIYGMLYQDQIARFEEQLELDFSFRVQGLGRFRVNILRNERGVEAVMRLIPSVIPSPKSIGLTDTILSLTKLPKGLVLVTGPTGSGKTTTLAAMLDLINQERQEHILTVEDPIEFVYENKGCVVRQREVGRDTHSFSQALKHALRQDPDVILVGEMRDLETISLALTAAETGHLVFATLHTQDAPQTVDRVIDVFPPHQQQQIRVQLGSTLKAVICQQLLPRVDKKGRVAAREVMIVTAAISNLIREGKTHQIYSSIETGAKFGMSTLETCLAQLVMQGLVTKEEALLKTNNQATLSTKLTTLPGMARVAAN